MRYITVEQFEEQSGEVQQALKGWAELNFKEMDLIYDAYHDEMSHIEQVHDTRGQDIDVGRNFYLHKCIMWNNMQCPDMIPLFTLQQLWEFIETRYKYTEVNNFHNKYEISAYKELSQINASVTGVNEDLLQAFWKCACEVARVVK